MSADRCSICPKCYAKEMKESEEKIEKLKNDLRKELPTDEVIRKRLELEEVSEKYYDEDEFPTNMREDWELGVDESGVFQINYRCHCSSCNFTWKYEKEFSILREVKE